MVQVSAQPATGWADLFAEGRLPRFAMVCLGIWLNAADALVTATIMPSVGADLGGYAYFSWATAGFLVGAILAGASAGRLSERFGLRWASAIAGLAFALGCVLSAAAPTIGIFLAGRVLQGIGSGWVAGFSMVAIAVLFPERHLARMFAVASGIWGIATILGPLVGGLFAQAGDWRAVFWLFTAQSLIFAAAAPWLLKGTVRSGGQPGVPWPQIGGLTLGVGAIAMADVSPNPAVALALVAAGLGILGLVLRIDGRARVRLLPRRAGDLRTVCGTAYAAIFALMATSMGLNVYGPAILQTLHGLSPLWAGYVVGGMALAWIVGAALLMGAGFGFSSSLLNRRLIGTLADDDKAIGSSALIAVRQTGGAVGAAIAGATANLVGFGAGLTVETARAAALWVFVTALPLALFGAWAAWRLTVAAKRSG